MARNPYQAFNPRTRNGYPSTPIHMTHPVDTSSVGRALQGLGAAIAGIGAKEQAEADQTAAQEAVTAAVQKMNDSWSNYAMKSSKEAYEGFGGAREDIATIKKDAVAGAANARQKQMINRSLARSQLHFDTNLSRHKVTEFKRWQNQTAESSVKTFAQQAILSSGAGNEEIFDEYARSAVDTARNHALKNGVDQETATSLAMSTRGMVVQGAIAYQLQKGNLDRANALFDKYRDKMDAQSIGRVESILGGRNQDVQVEKMLDGFLPQTAASKSIEKQIQDRLTQDPNADTRVKTYDVSPDGKIDEKESRLKVEGGPAKATLGEKELISQGAAAAEGVAGAGGAISKSISEPKPFIKEKLSITGWTRTDKTWAKLGDDERAAAMAVMEAGIKNPEDAKDAASAMINRARASGHNLGEHVSAKIYQPTITSAQHARLKRIIKSDTYKDVLTWVQNRRAGKEEDRVKGATHFLAHPKTMLSLEKKNPSLYKNWGPRGANWTGYDERTGKYKNQTYADKSHAFLAPYGPYRSGLAAKQAAEEKKQVASTTKSHELPPIKESLQWAYKNSGGNPELRKKLESAIRHRYAAFGQELSKKRVSLKQRADNAVAEISTTGGATDIPTRDEFASAYGHEAGNVMYNNLMATTQGARVTNDLRTLPLGEHDEAISGLMPQEGDPAYAQKKKAFDAVRKASAQLKAAAVKDSASYAASTSEDVSDALKATLKSDDPKVAQDYLDKLRGEQERLGIPKESRNILPKNIVASIAASLSAKAMQKESAGEVVGMIQAQKKRWGHNWGDIVREMKGNVSAPIFVATADGVKPETAALLIANAGASFNDLTKTGGKDTKTAIVDRLRDKFEDYERTASLSAESRKTFDVFYEQSKKLAAIYVTHGMSEDDAADNAYEELVGRRYSFTTQSGLVTLYAHYGSTSYMSGGNWDLRIPSSVSSRPDFDENLLNDKFKAITGSGQIHYPEFKGLNAEVNQLTQEQINRDARFVTAPDDRGVILQFRNKILTDKRGRPIVYSWDDIFFKPARELKAAHEGGIKLYKQAIENYGTEDNPKFDGTPLAY
jgi:hypothetical protein